jgi:hypothetical protein
MNENIHNKNDNIQHTIHNKNELKTTSRRILRSSRDIIKQLGSPSRPLPMAI